ncbi:hypothetical protein [Winogradskyella sp.]|uniref:hypothetical protein n=1 Tax=Winogradskyella sp. TaxID=1883156 RepID=UPI0026365410|nr:hypothetical protein [Winogradskyella sp.]
MKTNFTRSFSKIVFSLFLLLISLSVYSQEELDILEAYEEYTEAPREVVYLHLNKSTYVIGEIIGFTAYVLDKKDKRPSALTTNLYVSIEDDAKNIVKQKLIEVQNGVASNTIEVDSLFAHGNYRIKAYTNWMNNFNEQNHFIETIKIKDQKVRDITENETTNTIDAQFLPESGHLLHGVENTIGVVIKDKNGYGIPSVSGEVMDGDGNTITSFKTNQLGICRFAIVADISQNYTVKLDNQDIILNLNEMMKSHRNGVILSVKRLKDKFFVSAITNANTLNSIKNKRYSLVLHNGDDANLIDIYFTDHTVVTKVIELDSKPGLKILTLFNENDQPIAERLIFNYKDIPIIKSQTEPSITQLKDSVTISLNFKTIDPSAEHNISASILPQGTKSYKSDHSIISYNYLRPYVKGHIQNAKYYFTNIDERKKFELDNLLITQGWSSYDWNTIFKGSPDLSNDFEQGIIIKANYASKNLDESGTPNSLAYHFNNEGFLISEANLDQQSYVIKRLFPEEGNTIKLSEITSKKELKPANVYLQFFPREIPKLRNSRSIASNLKPNYKQDTKEESNDNTLSFETLKNIQKLNEVIVTANPDLLRRERENELKTGKYGRVSVINEDDQNTYIRLLDYLEYKAWNLATKTSGPNITTSRLATTPNSTAITNPFLSQLVNFGVNIFLNDALLVDYTRIEELFLTNVDYVEINRFGVGDGMRSPAGFIKIYTKNPTGPLNLNKNAKAYGFPLTFSKQKQFYAPKYKYYNDDFYKHYGTIDWKPNLKVDSNGNITMKIAQPEVPITLFIEGMANDGSFIFEEEPILLNKG